MPYEDALSVLDASWNWPGLRMYGHGIYVHVSALQDEADIGDCDGPTKGAVGGGIKLQACYSRPINCCCVASFGIKYL